MPAFISLTLAALLAAPVAPDTPPRYEVTGTLTKAPARSIDARFQIEAVARVDSGPGASSAIGRFTLKSTDGSVGCDTVGNIFRNGFE